MDLDALKAQIANQEKSLKKELTKSNSGGNNGFFKLKNDPETKVGAAVIRFLPQKDPTKLPWVDTYYHYFTGKTGEVYNQISATTFGKTDIIGQFNKWLWNMGEEDRARSQSRKRQFYSNIYVINSEDDQQGKVLTYRFGVKIYDKIKEVMDPVPGSGEEPRNPFDPFDGVNFRLKSHKQGDWISYDRSMFDQIKTPLAESDEELVEILEQVKDLSDFANEDKLLSDNAQITLLDKVFTKQDPLWVKFKSEVLGVTDEPTQTKPKVTEPTKKQNTPEKQETKQDVDTDSDIDPEILAILGAS